MSTALKEKMQKAVNRLFNIDVREVSLVDNPAIDETFTEVKSKYGSKVKESKTEEKAMDEKQVVEAIQKALQPLTEQVAGLSKRLAESEQSQGAKFDALKAEVVEIGQKAANTIKELNDKVEETIVDSEKHFEKLDGAVFVKGSQKINGGEGEEGKKSTVKWPSISNRLAGANR